MKILNSALLSGILVACMMIYWKIPPPLPTKGDIAAARKHPGMLAPLLLRLPLMSVNDGNISWETLDPIEVTGSVEVTGRVAIEGPVEIGKPVEIRSNYYHPIDVNIAMDSAHQ